MRLLLLVLTLAFGASVAPQQAAAQQTLAPYPVSVGEHLRVRIEPTDGVPPGGTYLSGRVRSLSADSLELAARPVGTPTVAWSRVMSVERRGESRTGEAIGLLVGGIVGGLAGYVIGDVTTSDPLGKVIALPGAIGGLLIGGVIGAKVVHSWEPVSAARPSLGFVVAVPIR